MPLEQRVWPMCVFILLLFGRVESVSRSRDFALSASTFCHFQFADFVTTDMIHLTIANGD